MVRDNIFLIVVNINKYILLYRDSKMVCNRDIT